jgi:hypothetical protein
LPCFSEEDPTWVVREGAAVNAELKGNYHLRNILSRLDERTGNAEGTAMLFAGEERVAKVALHAEDGSVEIQFKSNVDEYRFLRMIAQLPTDAFDAPFADRYTAAALFILELFDRGHETLWLKKRCRDSTVYRIAGDPEDLWRQIDVRFNATVARQLRKDAGGRLECIGNEMLKAEAA